MYKNKVKITPELNTKLKDLGYAILHTDGREIHDPDQIELPAGFDRPPTLQEQIQRCLRGHLSEQAQAQGMETFEESQDFDIPDDFELDPNITVHEMVGEDIRPPVPDKEEPTPAPDPEPEPDPELSPDPEPKQPLTGSNAPEG